MDELLESARSGDSVDRVAVMHNIDQLLAKWHVSGKELSADESKLLVQHCTNLLKDSDSSVSRGALDALSFLMALSAGADQRLMAQLDGLTLIVLERLGDESNHVREASRRFMVSLMEVYLYGFLPNRDHSYVNYKLAQINIYPACIIALISACMRIFIFIFIFYLDYTEESVVSHKY
jgi:hypothetical protein